jgi:hypothetical protein
MKRLPTALVVGLVIQLVFASARIGHWVLGIDPESWARWELLEAAFDVATAALIAGGMFELARGLRDRAALGARICIQGAELIARDPMGLPVATLVKGGDA